MPWPPVADVFSGFDKIFSRMTAAECVSICDAYGLLDSTPTVPDYLTAEGALTWMAYNGGAGAYYVIRLTLAGIPAASPTSHFGWTLRT